MSASVQYGVMHPAGDVITEQEKAGYPFRSRRMAKALADDLDDECDCGEQGHRVMVRAVGEWLTT